MRVNAWIAVAAVNGFLAVAAGAFASHATPPQSHAYEVFQIGARYHMYHALALGLAAFAMRGEATVRAQASAWLFLCGIPLFCGSLYALALTGVKAWAYATPAGGVLFLAGWVLLALAGLKVKP